MQYAKKSLGCDSAKEWLGRKIPCKGRERADSVVSEKSQSRKRSLGRESTALFVSCESFSLTSILG
jgi:hypothetical protein